jgi:cellulose synthase/poly-beta-1,6-N-acetylglucosamine synthase-like glycosyltransferase
VYFYYFLAAISCWLGLQSLLSGVRYAAYVRRETSRPLPDFQPFVSVIAPGRGLEPGLIENLRPLLTQDYRHYEVLFVFDALDDPAIKVIDELRSTATVPARIVIAGPATDTGQKVHNLRFAANEVDPDSEVLVFVDTDARPAQDWLRKLVAPLADETVGASTGYRWFIPERGGLASHLRSVWNASVASALGSDTAKNFCWGGSTAMRRATFTELNVSDHWRGTVSDDFTITRVLKDAKLPIHFTPNCLVASVGDCDFRELIEFTTRQIKITRVYASHLWLPLLLGSALFAIAFFGGLILISVHSRSSAAYIFPLIIFTLGATKSLIRFRAVSTVLKTSWRDLVAHILLWPFASLLYLYNAIVAGFSRRINWRGIIYELKSSTEAVIISRDY